MQTLTGKVALITGAARGMGRNHAVRLAQEGAAIIAIDICAPVAGIAYPMATPEDLAETERLVRATGSKIASTQVDTRHSDALQSAIDRAVAELGGLHIVVANAGVVAMARSEDFTQQQWDAVIGVNLTGTWNTMRAAVPHLTACGGGSIIAIASVAGLVGLPFLDPYVASKHGIVGLVKALAIELADRRIRVNAICPTGVSGTGITRYSNDNRILSTAPAKLRSTVANALQIDTVQMSDISSAVAYLASDTGRFITGIAMPVDAGLVDL